MNKKPSVTEGILNENSTITATDCNVSQAECSWGTITDDTSNSTAYSVDCSKTSRYQLFPRLHGTFNMYLEMLGDIHIEETSLTKLLYKEREYGYHGI